MGLFTTPEEVLQQQQQAEEAQARGLANTPLENMGAYTGYLGGRSLGGLLSGAQNPALQRAQAVQGAVNELNQSGEEVGTPSYFDKLTKGLQSKGLANEALSVQNYATQQGLASAQAKKAVADANEAQAKADQQKMLQGLLGNYLKASDAGVDPGALTGNLNDAKNPMRNPEFLSVLSVAANRPEYATLGERITKANEAAVTLKQAQDPEHGLFASLRDDPYVGKAARDAQDNLTNNRMGLPAAQSLFNTLAAKATSLATAQAQRDTQREEATLSPAALQVAAMRKLLFGEDPKGMGNLSTIQKKQVADESARQGNALGLSPTEQAMMPHDNRIKYRAIGKLTEWGATVQRTAEKLDFDYQTAIDYAKQLPLSQMQAITKAVLAGKTEFNNPAANAYATALNSVRTEYARMMSGPTSNAMLPVEAMKKGGELLSRGVDLPSLLEIRKVMQRDARNTVTATGDTINQLRDSVTGAGSGFGPRPGATGGAGGGWSNDDEAKLQAIEAEIAKKRAQRGG